MATKIYTKEFKRVLPTLFKVKAAFRRAYGGDLQVTDGVTDSAKFMTLKTTSTDVVIQAYSTDENVGFGTGTGKTSRFGERKEIKSVDTDVNYEGTLAIHEGIDAVTVNDDFDAVAAERMELQADAWTERLNGILGKGLSDAASKTLSGKLDEAGVLKAFDDAYKAFVNAKVSSAIAWIAYVTADVNAILIKSGKTTVGKRSSVNVDDATLNKHMNFEIEVVPETYFQSGEQIYFAAENAGVAGVGLQVYRALDSEDFAGVALQAAAKFGKYIPEKNKTAVLKAKLSPVL